MSGSEHTAFRVRCIAGWSVSGRRRVPQTSTIVAKRCQTSLSIVRHRLVLPSTSVDAPAGEHALLWHMRYSCSQLLVGLPLPLPYPIEPTRCVLARWERCYNIHFVPSLLSKSAHYNTHKSRAWLHVGNKSPISIIPLNVTSVTSPRNQHSK